jgi:hypothetical protein
MTRRFAFSTFEFLSAPSLLLLLLLPQALPAQESQSGAKSVPGTAAVAQAEPKTSKSDEDKSSNTNKDTAVLTREHVAVTAGRPKLVENADVPKSSFIRETYRSEWRTGDPFYIYVIRPKGVTKPPVILYLPSFPEDTDLFTNNKWCEMAVRGGYATVGFVGNVTGHRTRYRLLKEWFVSEMPEALSSTTHDVQLILDFLSSRGDFDMDHVAMFGNGSGASIAILASVVDSRIKVLDLQAPWGDWKDWLSESKVIPDNERATYTKPEFVASVSALDPVKWLPRIQAKSVRIEDVRGNKAMPDKAQKKLEDAAPDFALINQYGNGRAFLAADVPISMLDWVKSQLAPDAKPQVAMEKTARIHFFPALQPPVPANLANLPAPQPAKTPAPAKEQEKTKQNPR